jgi:guanylate kinase
VKVSSGNGVLYVISAPSGAGKSTVARRVVAETPGLDFSVSYTTRPRRAGEEDGRDYHFVERARFESMVEEDRFLEWAEVFGHRYGTGVEATRDLLLSGVDLLLDIDVQGAGQVRARGTDCVTIMLLPPDYETLEGRLRGRGSDSAATIAGRLRQARGEVEQYEAFDYTVINNDLADSVEEVVAIIRAEHRRTTRRTNEVKRILASFPA